jgi:2-keto-4-pentenoate hydratase/2-oxohepta-3-ene-1,7-dioic acid hydratase in catechol pathway
MKLASFMLDGAVCIGAVIDSEIVVATGHLAHAETMMQFLASGAAGLAALNALVVSGKQRVALSQVRLLSPIPRPGKFLGVGLNYPDHISETGFERPEYPTIFTKQSTCVIADGEAIQCPAISDKVDYEGELALVIGKRCKQLSLEQAALAIAGYTICNDVTVRDWQARSPTWTLGKSFDTHGPLGPWIVSADELADPHALSLKTWVDDELRQNGSTGEMLFNCFELVAYLSQVMTLEPGDVITTGTPAGVGVKMKPRGYLKPGQVVRIEIQGIGCLSNPVIAETDIG